MKTSLAKYSKPLFTASSLAALCAVSPLPAAAKPVAQPAAPPAKVECAPVQEQAMERWRKARFGMFIHWGPVSLKGTEISWSRGGKGIPVEEYDSLYKKFNPTKFNADEWVAVAKAAGMNYLVLTTKHHDGFCLWDTKQTDYNIMNSPFKRDVTKELAEACKKAGIAFGAYYSTCDWHHPDFPLTSPGGKTKRDNPNLDHYTEYLKAQVKELLIGYGPLWTLWFDVPQQFDSSRGAGIINMARAIQPDIVINNRTGAQGDYSTPEQHIGGFDNKRPWETCMTICHQWAWKPDDTMKSLEQCLQTLIFTVGGDGNLLFNVGPEPTGEIEGRQIERLKEMGAWLAKYGKSIYGTRGGPFKPARFGVSTFTGNSIYVHIVKWPASGTLTLPAISKKIVGNEVLTGGVATVKQNEQGITISVAEKDRQPIDTIVALQLDGPASEVVPVASAESSLANGKKVSASNVYGKSSEYGPEKAFDGDDDTRWATDAGTKQAWLEVDLGKPCAFDEVQIDEAVSRRISKFELQYKAGEEWKTIYAGKTVGAGYTHQFPAVTAQNVRLNILEASEGPTIRELRLIQAK